MLFSCLVFRLLAGGFALMRILLDWFAALLLVVCFIWLLAVLVLLAGIVWLLICIKFVVVWVFCYFI